MRVLAQRVSGASVQIDGITVGEIGPGLVLFVGVGREDEAGPQDGAGREDKAHQAGTHDGGQQASSPGRAPAPSATRGETRAVALAHKVANLRIFPDAEGRSNLSLVDINGSALVISQFTLYADCRRGRRPSFSEAADPSLAQALVEEFRLALERLGVPTAAGRFGAHMAVSLINDGPYTILLDSEALASPRRSRRAAAPGPSSSASGSLPHAVTDPVPDPLPTEQ